MLPILRTSLRKTTLTSLAVGSLVHVAACQATPAAPAAPAADPRLEGLPSFLLPVPGGLVEIGLTAEELVNTASECVSPRKPANAVRAPEKFVTALRRTASTLGSRKVQVETYLLGKWPVKNSEYEEFVRHQRQRKAKVRPPYHWWRYGQKPHYEQTLPEIAREFPKDSEGAVLYWWRHGFDLPYSVADDRGQTIGELPVSFVTYAEAMEFAGWLGMRLPTEVEWTRAARGDGTHLWPWGTSQPDVFDEKKLGFLELDKASGQKPTPIGAFANAAGPYGHQDMFGRIWQLVAGLGYGPINGQQPFDEAWAQLQKDKAGAMLTSPPGWRPDKVLAKGGCYLSWQEPVQLLIDARAPLQPADVLEGAGFRLAKSLKPGFDMLYSLVRGQYNRAVFGADQVLDEAKQVGIERYVLAANGFPTEYRAVSLMPVNWLTNDKAAELAKLLERTHTAPLLLGAFATTEPIKDPDLPPGLYTLLYRKEGMPKELTEAIKQGHKEIQAALKQKGKGEEEKADDKKGAWREVIKRFGITEADLETKEAARGLDFVRIDGVQIPTENDTFLLMSSLEGKVVGAIPASSHRPAPVKAFASELTLEKGDKEKAIAKFRFGVPIRATEPQRTAEFRFYLTLDCEPPSAGKPWRMPNTAYQAAPANAPAAPNSAKNNSSR